MRKVELLPTRDCEAGYGPDGIVRRGQVTKPKTFFPILILDFLSFLKDEVINCA